jgi:hypothetical protein
MRMGVDEQGKASKSRKLVRKWKRWIQYIEPKVHLKGVEVMVAMKKRKSLLNAESSYDAIGRTPNRDAAVSQFSEVLCRSNRHPRC